MAKRHKSYTESDLKVLFGIKKELDNTLLLDKWINTKPILEQELESIKLFHQLHQELRANVDYWNEYELEIFFIGPLLKIFVDYTSPNFLVYAERTIQAVVEGVNLKIEADLLLAKGVGEVLQVPYFCFHEYKRTKKGNADPVAQVLEAMLIAQEMNKNGKPVYGAYVIGKDWYFMVMEGKEYCISKAFEATQKDELLQIIAILREFRVILETTLID